MTVQPIDLATNTTARELRYRAVQILTRLLSEDLPEVTWTVCSISQWLHLFTDSPQDHEVLDGHADSHQAVRAWAAHLGTAVELRHGDTPMTSAVINGLGVRVWCAPGDRDDVAAVEA